MPAFASRKRSRVMRPVGYPAGRGRRGMGRFVRRVASKSLAGALSRVHTFKRVGEPVVITQTTAASRVLLEGNTDLLQPGITGSADSFIAAATQVRGAFRFCLAQAANITEITNLFDNYRIKRVRLMFAFSGTEAGVQAAASLPAPLIHYCYDPDDNTTPASRTAVLENGYCRSRRLENVFYVDVTPRAQQSVVGGAGGAGGLLPVGNWLDANSPNIYHFGLKFWIDQFPFATNDRNYCLTVTPTFYLEAKNVV